MKARPVECAEIRSGFVAGQVPAGAGVTAHLESCPHCRELFENDARLGRYLAGQVLPAVDPGALFDEVGRDVEHEAGVRARLRSLTARTRAGALVAVGLVLLASQLWLQRRGDFAEYSPAVFWVVVATLTAGLAWGSWRLVRGVHAPLRAAEREGTATLLLLLLPALVALLSPLGSPSGPTTDEAAWGSPLACFSYGAVMVTPFLLLAWLFERRDRMPRHVLVSAGALSGLAANLLLHAHCGSAHLGHLLLGHAGVGVAWALGCALLSARLARA